MTNLPYLIAVVIMAAIGVVAIVILEVVRPSADNTSLIASISVLIVPTTVSLLAFMKAQETHNVVNSRMDEFKRQLESAAALAEKAAHASGVREGMAAGVSAANSRTDKLADSGH